MTHNRLREIQTHRECLTEWSKAVQGSFGVRLKKGFTCTSREYHTFMEHLVRYKPSIDLCNISSGELMLPMIGPVHAVVEAESSCRRAVVTDAGLIRLGAGMSATECARSIDQLSALARETSAADKANLMRCKDAVSAVQWQLGLQKVYRTGTVSHDDFLDCLSRFLVLPLQESEKQLVYNSFTGVALGVASIGRFCHLADDGSIVVPHNWR